MRRERRVLEENGSLALLAMAKYFSKLPKAARKRYMVFVIPDHSRGPICSASPEWIERPPEILRKTIAWVTVEHLGCREWFDNAGGEYAASNELVLLSLMYGPQAGLFAELFPVEARYSGASLGYQIGSVVGGGLAPIIATALCAQYKSSAPIAVYLAATCAISPVSTIALSLRARTVRLAAS